LEPADRISTSGYEELAEENLFGCQIVKANISNPI
jgi:hypothetical protein